MIKSSILSLVFTCRRYTGQMSFLNVIRKPNFDEPIHLTSFRFDSSNSQNHLDSTVRTQKSLLTVSQVAIKAVLYPLKNVIISFILPAVLNPVELRPVGDVLKPALDRLSIIVSREG